MRSLVTFLSRTPGMLGTALALLLTLTLTQVDAWSQQQQPAAPQSSTPAIDVYINHAWSTLRRSMLDCATLADPKITAEPVLWLPQDFAEPPEVAALEKEVPRARGAAASENRPAGREYPLARAGTSIPAPSLRCPRRTLQRDVWVGQLLHRAGSARKRARGHSARHGGELLLRDCELWWPAECEPHLLSHTIAAALLIVGDSRGVGCREEPGGGAWLERAYGYAVRDHALWTSEPHRAGNTGLARYFDLAKAPLPRWPTTTPIIKTSLRGCSPIPPCTRIT